MAKKGGSGLAILALILGISAIRIGGYNFTKMIEYLMRTYFDHEIKPIEWYEQNSVFIEIPF